MGQAHSHDSQWNTDTVKSLYISSPSLSPSPSAPIMTSASGIQQQQQQQRSCVTVPYAELPAALKVVGVVMACKHWVDVTNPCQELRVSMGPSAWCGDNNVCVRYNTGQVSCDFACSAIRCLADIGNEPSTAQAQFLAQVLTASAPYQNAEIRSATIRTCTNLDQIIGKRRHNRNRRSRSLTHPPNPSSVWGRLANQLRNTRKRRSVH